jgi:hypothetical protein
MLDNRRVEQRIYDQHLQNRLHEQRLLDQRLEKKRQERRDDERRDLQKQQPAVWPFGSNTPSITTVSSSPRAAPSLKSAVIKTGLLLAGVVWLAALGKDEEDEP